MLTVRSTINISSQTVPPIIPVVQGDTGRAIMFTLADFTIPAGASATYYVQKPSGEAVYNNATIDGNTVLVELTAQSIIEKGDNYGQVRISSNGEVVTSFDFILLVKEFRGIDAVQSLTEMNIFDKAVEQASDAIDEVKTDALDDIGDAKEAALQEIEQTTGNFADDFSASATYAAGDYVMHSGQLYRFTANHADGAWTGSDAEAVTVGEELTDLKAETSDLKEDYTTILDSAYVTDTASGSIASFSDGADSVPVKSLKVNIEPVQSGSGDPSPDNVRPISGWTGVNVTRTGKNLLAKPFVYYSSASATVDDCFFIKAGQYIFHFDTTSATSWRFGIRLMDKDGNFLSDSGHNPASGLFYNASVNVWLNGANVTIKEIPLNIVDDCYIRIVFANGDTSASTTVTGAQLEVGSTATVYEPYQGQTVTIDLGGTRYGGTLDVGTGVLTVDRQIVDLGTLNWTQSNTIAGAPYPHRWFSNAVNNMSGSATTANGLCNKYATVPYSGSSADPNVLLNGQRDYVCSSEVRGYINVIDSAKDSLTPAQFKTAMDGTYIVYKLANPFEVTLTAQEVRTILGTNNIWSDAGDVEVEYRADTRLYIEKLTAPTEDDMIADHAISANSFFMIGNTLYRATTAIASGATITVGTNATKLSLSDALNALA